MLVFGLYAVAESETDSASPVAKALLKLIHLMDSVIKEEQRR